MRPWQYQSSANINKSISESLTVFPRERDMSYTLLRGMGRVFFRSFLACYFRLSVHGRKNLPRNSTYVLVANHASHLDAICLSAILPTRNINNEFVAAAKDYFFSSFVKSIFSVIFFNALPFDRQHTPRKSLELCADILNASDQVLIMFPEGTRSLSGEMLPFKPGIGMLVAGTDRLVVPVYISGASRAWAKGKDLPSPTKVDMYIGHSMNFSNCEKGKDSYVAITQQIENAVRELKYTSEVTMKWNVKYAVARCFMKTVGMLSDGIRLCYKEGLTSGKMVDYIYRNKPAGKSIIGRMIDRNFLSDPGWEAVRTRRENLESLIVTSIDALRKQHKSISLLDIASGPGAYILSVIEKVGGGDVFARCRDFESRWIVEGNREAQRRNLHNVIFEEGDAFSRTQILSLTPRPNLAVASGFYDWFNDDAKVKESMNIVYDVLDPGGYFVFSNQSAHPKLEFTEQVFTDFNKNPLHMTMRSKDVMCSYARDIGFEVEQTLNDSHGYYVVIQAKKP